MLSTCKAETLLENQICDGKRLAARKATAATAMGIDGGLWTSFVTLVDLSVMCGIRSGIDDLGGKARR